MKQVNAEIAALGAPYMRYRRCSTHFLSFDPDVRGSMARYSDGFVQELCSEKGKKLIVGTMIARAGSGRAYMLCAADDPMDEMGEEQAVSFRFGTEYGKRRAILHRAAGDETLAPDESGCCRFTLDSCEGALLEIVE